MSNPIDTMQELVAQMARLQAEMADLKSRPSILNQPQPAPEKTLPAATSRRKALGRIGGSLIAAGLASSLPILTSAAASDSSSGPGPHQSALTSNMAPNLAGDGSLTDTYGGFDFQPIASNTNFNNVAGGGLVYAGTGNKSFIRRLTLPQAAKIKTINFYYTDNDPTFRMVFSIVTIDPVNRTFLTILNPVSSSGPSASAQVSTITVAANDLTPIDNSAYSYVLSVTFNSTTSQHTLWGANVSYVNIVGRFQAQ